MLGQLIRELEGRLKAEDVDSHYGDFATLSTLPKRLRDEAAWLAALLTHYAIFTDTGKPEEHARIVEQGMYWATIAGDRLQEILLRMIQAWGKVGRDNQSEIAGDYRRALHLAVEGKHFEVELEIRSRLVEWLIREGELEMAEGEITKLHDIVERELTGETRRFHLSRTHRHLGILLARRNNTAKAIEQLQLALHYAEEKADPNHCGVILVVLSDIHHSLGSSAEAIEYLLGAAELGKRTGREIISTNAYARIGEINLALNDLEAAGNAFELAERIISNAPLTNLYRNIQYRKLPFYLKSTQLDDGIAICGELLDYYPASTFRIRILSYLGQFLEKQGKLRKAERALREAHQIKPFLSISVMLARVLKNQEKDEEAQEILLAVCNQSAETLIQRESLAEGLEMLAELAGNRNDWAEAVERQKKAFEIRLRVERDTNETSVRNARIVADLKIREQKEEMGLFRWERSNKQLAALLTGLSVTHGRFLDIEGRLRKNLEWLEPEQIERVVLGIKDALTDLTSHEAVKQVTAEAEAVQALQRVEESFFEKLQQRWPDLTRKQQQFCGLIHAGLQTSQIASLLGITHNAVWKKRKRLRKKMNLGEEEELDEVIAGIG